MTVAPGRNATPTPPPPRTPAAPPAPAPRAAITVKARTPKPPAPRVVFYSVAGFGKTTTAAHAPSPLILMAPRETGYDTLLSRNLVPQVPAEIVPDFPTLLGWLDSLAADPQGVRTLVLDTISAMGEMCEEWTRARYFKDDAEDYLAFGRGVARAAIEWAPLLRRLDAVNARGVTVLALGHSQIQKFKNPQGNDFDRYIVDMKPQLWGPTFQWADDVLFGEFHVVVAGAKKPGDKGKGIGGDQRVVHAQWNAAFDAKGKDVQDFSLGDNPAENWATVWAALTARTAGGEAAGKEV